MLETDSTSFTPKVQTEATVLLAKASDHANWASLLLERSMHGIPLRHYQRLKRIVGAQQALAHTFARLSVAFSSDRSYTQ